MAATVERCTDHSTPYLVPPECLGLARGHVERDAVEAAAERSSSAMRWAMRRVCPSVVA